MYSYPQSLPPKFYFMVCFQMPIVFQIQIEARCMAIADISTSKIHIIHTPFVLIQKMCFSCLEWCAFWNETLVSNLFWYKRHFLNILFFCLNRLGSALSTYFVMIYNCFWGIFKLSFNINVLNVLLASCASLFGEAHTNQIKHGIHLEYWVRRDRYNIQTITAVYLTERLRDREWDEIKLNLPFSKSRK